LFKLSALFTLKCWTIVGPEAAADCGIFFGTDFLGDGAGDDSTDVAVRSTFVPRLASRLAFNAFAFILHDGIFARRVGAVELDEFHLVVSIFPVDVFFFKEVRLACFGTACFGTACFGTACFGTGGGIFFLMKGADGAGRDEVVALVALAAASAAAASSAASSSFFFASAAAAAASSLFSSDIFFRNSFAVYLGDDAADALC